MARLQDMCGDYNCLPEHPARRRSSAFQLRATPAGPDASVRRVCAAPLSPACPARPASFALPVLPALPNRRGAPSGGGCVAAKGFGIRGKTRTIDGFPGRDRGHFITDAIMDEQFGLFWIHVGFAMIVGMIMLMFVF